MVKDVGWGPAANACVLATLQRCKLLRRLWICLYATHPPTHPPSTSSPAVKAAMYAYGKHLGLAFQVVDDILDFTQSSELLGKPQGQDLASGNLTAPAIYALQVWRWACGQWW